jgi:DNA recombination protein RmuC
MTMLYLLLGLVVVGLVALAISIWATRRPAEKGDQLIEFNKMFATLDQNVQNNLRESREATDRLKKSIEDELFRNRQSSEKATANVFSQVQSFTKGMTELQETVKNVQDSVKNVASFQDIFKSPKLRGIWGEASLESALGQYFGKDQYEIQHYFKSGEAVDAIIKLPDGLMLPIDSKFNWENFEKMVNSDNELNREMHRKQFLSDVKKKVDEISSKYILPSENTTDMAMMYVPAETVYYELINNIKEADIPKYARSKKIILVSPNTFYLTVTAVHHWFRDVEVNKQTKDIIKRLERIKTDGAKLADDFRVLGKHLTNAHGSYDDTEKRLDLMMDRVKNVIEIGEAQPKIDMPKE